MPTTFQLITMKVKSDISKSKAQYLEADLYSLINIKN